MIAKSFIEQKYHSTDDKCVKSYRDRVPSEVIDKDTHFKDLFVNPLMEIPLPCPERQR